jgi:hypothetical protein
MRTPWSNLLKYGTAIAVILVLAVSIIGLLLTVAVAVVVSKILVFTR